MVQRDDPPNSVGAVTGSQLDDPGAQRRAGDGGATPRDGRRAVIASLAAATDQVIAAPRHRPDEDEAAREKAVLHECRYLMRLLAIRRRSAGELQRRLLEREVAPSVAHEVLARIDRAGLIDDAAFAADWVSQRRRMRGLSDQALRRELEARDVADSVIGAALGRDVHGEEERARDLVRGRLETELRRAGRTPDAPTRSRIARRLDGLLRRRGYDGALALRVISTELRAATGR